MEQPKHKLLATASCQIQGVHSENLIDRFSSLPDNCAHHILSSFSIEDLIRFGCVSKRCKELCLSTPSLKFWAFRLEDTTPCEERLKLMNSLDRFLFQRGDNRIQSFTLYWDCHYVEDMDQSPCFCVNENFRIISWMHNAVRCNVEELILDLSSIISEEDERLPFPSCVFHCPSLRFLQAVQVTGMIFKTPSFDFTSNLTCLDIGNLKVEDESFFKWISCCCKCLKKLSISGVEEITSITIESPVLETFDFYDPCRSGLCHLKVSGEKLENISIHWGFGTPSKNSLNIFAPSLIDLRWVGSVMDQLNLGNLECLEVASLFLEAKADDYENVYKALCSLRMIGVLVVNEGTIKASFKEGSMPAQLDEIWSLTMYLGCYGDNLIPSVVSLLRGMPYLSTLRVKYDTRVYSHVYDLKPDDVEVEASGLGMEYWRQQNLPFIPRLEEVSMELSNGSNEIELARYILEHAKNLVEMVITYLPGQADAMKKLAESKVTSKAKVIFKENQDKRRK